MRDLETGELDDEFATIFRTLPVAFAYAEMSACFDRFASAEIEKVDDPEGASDLEVSEKHFAELSGRLRDSGLNGSALQAWERRTDDGPRRVLH
jgi:hypothetical protein